MIQIRNLHHRYPDATYALRGIDLHISKGEFLLICGSNGSGKTTLLRIMSGLLKPTDGSISINGFDPVKDPRKVRQIVGMVFQDTDSQIVGETVREDVAFSALKILASLKKRSTNGWIGPLRRWVFRLSQKNPAICSPEEKRDGLPLQE